MFAFARTKPLASTTTTRDLGDQRRLAALILCVVLLLSSGCGDSEAPVAPSTQAGWIPVAGTPETESAKSDPLADVLRLAEAGDVDAAVEQLGNALANWPLSE